MKRYRALAISLLLALPGVPGAAETGGRPATPKPQAHDHRAAKKLMLENAEGASVTLWKPDLSTQPLSFDQGGFTLPKTGMDNYHALVAERRPDATTLEAAIRFVYLRGKPSGNSPSLLTTAVKTPLDIVPAPLPREHRHYQANHDAVFVLRFKGKPLANAPVALSTANGSHLQLVTDRIGALRFTLPDDFPATEPGRENNRPAEFVLQAETERDGRTYRTSLSGEYHVDPAHWQSFELGMMVLGAGFVTGLVVNRRKPKQGRAG